MVEQGVEEIEKEGEIKKIDPVLEGSKLRLNGVSLLLNAPKEIRFELFGEMLLKLPESPLLVEKLADFAINEIIVIFEKMTRDLFGNKNFGFFNKKITKGIWNIKGNSR
jgi:hypothetical protein